MCSDSVRSSCTSRGTSHLARRRAVIPTTRGLPSAAVRSLGMERTNSPNVGHSSDIETREEPQSVRVAHRSPPTSSPLHRDDATQANLMALSQLRPRGDGQLLTPAEVAAELRVAAEQVRCLIRTGELAAINVGTGPKRPLYRITRESLNEFKSRRFQPGPAIRVRPATRRPPVRDFFPDLA